MVINWEGSQSRNLFLKEKQGGGRKRERHTVEATCFRVGNYTTVAVISFYVWNREREIRILDATERKRPNSLVPANLQRVLPEAQYFSLSVGWSLLPFIHSCISKIKGELLKANHSQFHLQKLIFFYFCLFFCFITLVIYLLTYY